MKFYRLSKDRIKDRKTFLQNTINIEALMLSLLKNNKYRTDLLFLLRHIEMQLECSILNPSIKTSNDMLHEIQEDVMRWYQLIQDYSETKVDGITVHPLVLHGIQQYLRDTLLSLHKTNQIGIKPVPESALSESEENIIIDVLKLRTQEPKYTKTHFYSLLHILYHTQILIDDFQKEQSITNVRSELAKKLIGLSKDTMKDYFKKNPELKYKKDATNAIIRSLQNLVKPAPKLINPSLSPSSISNEALEFLQVQLLSKFSESHNRNFVEIINVSDDGLSKDQLLSRLSHVLSLL